MQIQNFIKRLISIYLYGSLHIGIGAFAMSYQTFLLLDQGSTSNTNYLFLALFSTIAFYSLHRLVDLDKMKKLDKRPKYLLIQRNKKVLIILGLLSFVAAIYFLILQPGTVILFLLGGGILTLWYSFPLAFSIKKLREYAQIKIILVAIIWGLVTALIPAYLSGIRGAALLLILFERSIFIFALTLPFDVRDYVIDYKLNIKTIPFLMGKKRSLVLAVFLIGIFQSSLIVLLYYINIYGLHGSIALLSSNAVIMFLIWNSKNKTHDYYFTGLLDGMLILQPILLILIAG